MIQDLPDAPKQFPQITLLLGRRLKEKALRKLCDSQYRGQRRKNNLNIRVDNRSLHSVYPKFFADCDPTALNLQEACTGPRTCHQDQLLSFGSLPSRLHDLLLCRLIFLFVDVVCVFADDLGGLDAVKSLLLTWANIGSGSSLPRVVRPRVIIVTRGEKSVTSDILEEKDLLFDLHAEADAPYETFADVRFCRLPSAELSPSARFLSLNAEVTRQLHDARFVRLQKHVLFSATHLSDMFTLATQNFCASPLTKFDFIAATRQANPLDGSFGSHLKEFLLLAGRSRIPYEGVSSQIASALLMDAYPPGMHC